MKKIFLIAAFIYSFIVPIANAQQTFPVNGAANQNHNYYAFTNARIFIDYQTVVEKGTLLIKDGIVVQVGNNVTIPAGCVVYNLDGKSIYPSFIDAYTGYGMPEIKKTMQRNFAPVMVNPNKGAYNWNAAVHPEVNASELFEIDEKNAEELKKLGFGTVLTHQPDGIARGTAALVLLGNSSEHELMLKNSVAAMYSFSKGTSVQDYPSSLMGSIALLRQTYYDAIWYKENTGKVDYNISLESFNQIQTIPQIFETSDKLNVLRADKIGDEFKIQYIFKGSGNEYQRMSEIKSTNASFILPLNFPDAYDVEDPFDALNVSLTELMHWEMAPMNLASFEKNFIPFAITTSDLKNKKDFFKNLQKAMEYGLSEKQALKALTYTPAEMLGVQNKVGSLKPDMLANFIITSGNIFDEKNILYQNWVKGQPYYIKSFDQIDVRGDYNVKVFNQNLTVKINGDAGAPKVTVMSDTNKLKTSFTLSGNSITLSVETKSNEHQTIRFTGNIFEHPLRLKGSAQSGSGAWSNWEATLTAEYKSKPDAKKDSLQKNKDIPVLDDVIYPFAAYGTKKQDSTVFQKFMNRWNAILIKNVTVWTNEQEGILKNKDVLITDGKIVRIADNIEVPKTVKVLVMDGTGKHLTAGIVDEHSHIAISNGVNEGTQVSSAEVRIGDVVNSEDVNIYRQLAGGVVACQQLHGSANPIGGQSSIIKLKWGASPEEMKIKWADGFIKFALGENVKQSNWGDFNTVRFPQTRMGVEQVYYDYFIRAKEYKKQWDNYAGLSAKDKLKTTSPRKDLDMEAISEILNKKRFISCHSYVQSEINMLMHIGDSMGFRVNTFTHILEGYKVADKMKAHGAGASSFADWWAYKMEVRYAIPYNAAILTKMGVITAINSDDAEMARRLNQEAAKSVKYGGLTEEEALKLVTLNPCKLLHLDSKMGSIKVGKDADVVLWTDNPLSIYAKADKTIIEGVVYYDREKDELLNKIIEQERARIILKMLKAKQGGAYTVKPTPKKQILYHCDTEEGL